MLPQANARPCFASKRAGAADWQFPWTTSRRLLPLMDLPLGTRKRLRSFLDQIRAAVYVDDVVVSGGLVKAIHVLRQNDLGSTIIRGAPKLDQRYSVQPPPKRGSGKGLGTASINP
jgi:hypothetical protein